MIRLEFPDRPRVRKNATLGKRQQWVDSTRCYVIDRFVDQSGKFIACLLDQDGEAVEVLSVRRTLNAAKRVCQQHARRAARAAARKAGARCTR